jgi:pimeloyl-ACP methyl ester carboxylesterase
MCANDCWDNFSKWRKLGYNVMIPDYLGYGMSGGKPSEAGCRATADAAYDWLVARGAHDARANNPHANNPHANNTAANLTAANNPPGNNSPAPQPSAIFAQIAGAPPPRIVSVGWSIGSGVAADLAFRRPVAGLALFSAFTSMADMGQRMFPWLPVNLVIADRFDTLSKIPHIACPIFLAHGTRDQIIPFDMSARLRAAASSLVHYDPIDGADHNNIFSAGGDDLLKRFGEFLGRIP